MSVFVTNGAPAVAARPFIAVAVGGALGTLARHGALFADWRSSLVVLGLNLAGSTALGALVALRASAGRGGLHDPWFALLGVGFCGGLTTFSTHALEVASHLERSRWLDGAGSLIATTALCLAGAGLGFRVANGHRPPPTTPTAHRGTQ